MPIENEYKFPLDDSKGLLEKQLNEAENFQKVELKQAYLRKGCRVREWKEKDKDTRYIFSFKQRVRDNVVEIETDISKEDFLALWSVSECGLSKVRYKKSLKDIQWDIDFLKEGEKTYFAMAEVEIPPEKRVVPPVLDILKPYAIGRMERHCKALSNKKLCNKDYAARVLSAFVNHTEPPQYGEDVVLSPALLLKR